ncbi:MAG: WG repeat-containing protein [Clostridia bacterium]|nr:WG repeat-containing protein [Clostridia bacterium]
MSRGKRYNGEQKLNLKKVFAVLIAIIVVILFIVGIKQILKADKNKVVGKNIELNYFTLFTNGNWGVINSSGDIVVEPANGEMIIIPNKAKPVFICTYEVNYVDGTYKTKVINDKNQQLFTNYDNIVAVQNYDENHNLWYEENVLKVQKNGKYGLINLDGNEILPCEYDSIDTLKGIKNSIVIKKDNKIGIVNSDGTVVVPADYQEVTALTADYKNGYIVKNAESKYGVIKSDGQIALECKFEKIDNIADNGKYIAKIDGTWKVVAEDGNEYLEGKVANVTDMNNGEVIVNNDGKFGVINIAEENKIPNEYEELVYMFDNKYVAKKDGKYGIINTNNEKIVDFKYSEIIYNKTTDYVKAKKEDGKYDYMARDLSVKLTAGEEKILNGFISIANGTETKYYNYKLEEKSNKDVYTTNTIFVYKENGKYGFKDKDGKVVVEAKYDDVTEQNDYGYVAVKKDGKWGSLDQYGKVVTEPTCVIKSGNTVNFIGKWHVCADNNANYYTDLND